LIFKKSKFHSDLFSTQHGLLFFTIRMNVAAHEGLPAGGFFLLLLSRPDPHSGDRRASPPLVALWAGLLLSLRERQ
jgi:hypothetical protein